MANDTDTFLQRVARFDNGSELGPRVLKAGIIDGTGEFAGPTKMRVDTAEQAVQDVDWYADHGYAQIKIYSSVKPELVPIIADRAHARGLRVSGHVPAFMSARQFLEGGKFNGETLLFRFATGQGEAFFGAREATIFSKRGSPRSESHSASRRSSP